MKGTKIGSPAEIEIPGICSWQRFPLTVAGSVNSRSKSVAGGGGVDYWFLGYKWKSRELLASHPGPAWLIELTCYSRREPPFTGTCLFLHINVLDVLDWVLWVWPQEALLQFINTKFRDVKSFLELEKWFSFCESPFLFVCFCFYDYYIYFANTYIRISRNILLTDA